MLIQILLEKNVSLSKLCDIITLYPQVLINAKINSSKKDLINEDVEIKQYISKLEQEFKENGRVIVRPSGTEPLIRVMIEGENIEYITKKAQELVNLIEQKLN